MKFKVNLIEGSAEGFMYDGDQRPREMCLLEDERMSYDLSLKGPRKWSELKDHNNYSIDPRTVGNGNETRSRMATFGEMCRFNLYVASFFEDSISKRTNQEKISRNVNDTFYSFTSNNWNFAGDTLVARNSSGLFVIDFPDSEIVSSLTGLSIYNSHHPDYNILRRTEERKEIPISFFNGLKSRLGSREERGVTFSNDERVRFMPWEASTNNSNSPQSFLDLARNPEVLALTGSLENLEALACHAKFISGKFSNPKDSWLEEGGFPLGDCGEVTIPFLSFRHKGYLAQHGVDCTGSDLNKYVSVGVFTNNDRVLS